jgi:prepilin-type N-terminal cleavage/methylation domain-containing protein
MNKTLSSQSGFTLVEVLVAITLLLMVIVGPLQILSRTNNSTAFATEQMTAWFLAQEGLELAQQARDGYILQYFEDTTSSFKPWTSFVSPIGVYKECFKATGCNIVLDKLGAVTVTACGTTDCDLAKLDSTKRMRYNTSNGVVTTPTFTRKITMTETGAGREVAATSTVIWRTGSLIASQKVETATVLFNIYDTQ